MTFAERNVLCDGIDELKSQTEFDERQIEHLIKVIAKYEDKARELRDKLEKLIEELRKLKNKLLIIRAETIRLDDEICKYRNELHDLHLIYHTEWRELQRLDKEFRDKSGNTHAE